MGLGSHGALGLDLDFAFDDFFEPSESRPAVRLGTAKPTVSALQSSQNVLNTR